MLIKRLVFIQMFYLLAKSMFERLNLFIFYISPYIFEIKKMMNELHQAFVTKTFAS